MQRLLQEETKIN